MKTKLTRSPDLAAEFLLKSELVAFPTETVYGLGANLFDENAVRKIFAAKGRPTDNPLIAHIAQFSELDLLVRSIPPAAERLMEAFFPAPLTLLMPKSKYVPAAVSAGLDTIGVRMPRHETAQKFLKACGVSVAAPSANLSGKPSPTTWQAVKTDLDGRIACILQGAPIEVGLESTVVDCTGKSPVILRTGAVTLAELQAVVPETRLATKLPAGAAPKSPGMKYRHYAPAAKVVLVDSLVDVDVSAASAYIGLTLETTASIDVFALMQLCHSVSEYARTVFNFFRACDAKGVKVIYCQRVPESGLGLALMDRLQKAAFASPT